MVGSFYEKVASLKGRWYVYNMKKITHTLSYYFDYYIGYFLSSRSTDKWSKRIIEKYPERFPNEIKYLEELKNKTK